MRYVLDACALIAYLRKEPGGEIVRDILLNSRNSCHIHSLNLCEVYYDIFRSDGESVADEMVRIIAEIGVVMHEELDETIWRYAARIKATIKKISLADTVAIALAHQINGVLLTSDHSEFDKIVESNFCSILFIR